MSINPNDAYKYSLILAKLTTIGQLTGLDNVTLYTMLEASLKKKYASNQLIGNFDLVNRACDALLSHVYKTHILKP